MPTVGSCIWILGYQVVALSRKTEKSLGGGTWLEEVDHKGSSLAPLPFHAQLPKCGCIMTSQLVTKSSCLLPHLPCHDGLCPSGPWAIANSFSCKSLLSGYFIITTGKDPRPSLCWTCFHNDRKKSQKRERSRDVKTWLLHMRRQCFQEKVWNCSAG